MYKEEHRKKKNFQLITGQGFYREKKKSYENLCKCSTTWKKRTLGVSSECWNIAVQNW